MKYYLIVGEASGDLHAAHLIKELKRKDPKAMFRYVGGDRMLAAGGTLAKHYASFACMGFVEILTHLPRLLEALKFCKKDIIVYQPDVLILIDFAGFNLKIAAFAKQQGIQIYYYIPPKVWAWNQKRVVKMRRLVDRILCIFPFEVDFYRTWGIEVTYVGHPLLDAIKAYRPDPDFVSKYTLGPHPIIALLPGSRKQEIERLLPDMLATAKNFPGYQFVIAGVAPLRVDYYKKFIGKYFVPIVFDATYDLLHYSCAALVASGTATLEAALLQVPQVVLYKGAPISMFIARLLIKIKHISLVNLIMKEPIVQELIQQHCTVSQISMSLRNILFNKCYRQELWNAYQQLTRKIGEPGASARAAALMLAMAKYQ